MTTLVYETYTQETLDRAYDQREWASNTSEILALWQQSAPLRESLGCHEVAYGEGGRQKIDIYPATGTSPAPVHFHVHGGAWKRQNKEGCTFMVPAQQQAGMLTVVPDFDLLPDVSLTELFAQLTQAFVHTVEQLAEHGGDASRIVVSGHSSGAHLAALLAAQDFTGYGLPADAIKSLLLISGPYDLEPVLLSSRRQYIHLDSNEAVALNAYTQAKHIHCPVGMLFGENESPEFIRQSQAMTDRLKALGKPVSCAMVPGVNHFEVMSQLGDPGSQAFNALQDAVPKTTGAA